MLAFYDSRLVAAWHLMKQPLPATVVQFLSLIAQAQGQNRNRISPPEMARSVPHWLKTLLSSSCTTRMLELMQRHYAPVSAQTIAHYKHLANSSATPSPAAAAGKRKRGELAATPVAVAPAIKLICPVSARAAVKLLEIVRSLALHRI